MSQPNLWWPREWLFYLSADCPVRVAPTQNTTPGIHFEILAQCAPFGVLRSSSCSRTCHHGRRAGLPQLYPGDFRPHGLTLCCQSCTRFIPRFRRGETASRCNGSLVAPYSVAILGPEPCGWSLVLSKNAGFKEWFDHYFVRYTYTIWQPGPDLRSLQNRT